MVEMKKTILLLELNLIFGIEKNEFVGSTVAINIPSRARMSDSLLALISLRALISSSYNTIDPGHRFLSKICFV